MVSKPGMGHPLVLHPKVVAATGGGTTGILIVWVLSLVHVTVDPVVGAALATAVAGFFGWLAPIVDNELRR